MAKVLWSEVESRPWFAPLPPEEKAKVLDQWTQDTLAETQSDEEKLLLEASSDAIKKTYFGEPMPTDFNQYVRDFGLAKSQQKVQQEAEKDLPFISLADTASALGDVFRGLPPTLKASYYQITEGDTRPDKRSDAYKQAMAERDAFLDSLQQVPEGQKTDVGEAIRGAAGSIGFTGIAAGSALAAGAIGRAVGTRVGGAVGGTLGGAAGAPAGGVGAIPGAVTGATLGSTTGGAAGQKIGQYLGGLLGSGTAAYKLAYEDFRHEAFKQAEQNKGAPLTDDEAEKLDQQIKPLAENTAAWEAGPEAIGTVVSLGTAKALYGLTKEAMTELGKRTLGRLVKAGAVQAGGTGVELTTEAITQYNQAYDQAKLAAILQGKPLEEAVKPYEGVAGLVEAGKEVAPTVLALQGLLGGGAALAGKLTAKKPTELTSEAFTDYLNQQRAAAVAQRDAMEGAPAEETPSIFKRVRALETVKFLDKVADVANKGNLEDAAAMVGVKIVTPEQAARNVATPPPAEPVTPPAPVVQTPPTEPITPPPADEEVVDTVLNNPVVQGEKKKAADLSAAAANANANGAQNVGAVAEALAEKKNAEANALVNQLVQGVSIPTFGPPPMAGPLQSAARPAPAPVVSPAVEEFRTSLDELMQVSDRANVAVQDGDIEGARAILTNAQAALSLPPQYLNSLSPEDQTQVQTLAADASARLGELLGSLPAPTTQTPIQTNAPQERQIPEGGQPKRVDVDEGRTTPEAGGGNRFVEGREVSEEDVTALAAVATNTATPEQVRDLVSKKLVRDVGGQPVIRDAALGVLPEGQRPPLTEAQRVAELTKEPVRRTEILRFQIQQRSDSIKKGWTENKFAAANSFFVTGDPKELETLTKAQREAVLRVATNYDQEGKKSKVPRATQRTKGSMMSKALAEMPDPDNPDAQNIIARIARRGGRILKPSAAWLARQKKEGTPYTRGDWDAINNLNLPLYYSNLLFEAGDGSGLDQSLIALAGEGYFPGYTAETITPEVFAEKLARTIDAYNKVLAGLPSNAVEEAEAMVARDEADRLEFEGFIFGTEGTVVDPGTLRVGDKLTINGDVMTVTNLQFPEVETAKRPDFIELTGVRYGRQLVSTEEDIRAEAIERTAPPVDEFALEAPTAEELQTEAETQRQREQIREGQGTRLTGTAGEMGTPDMFDVTAGEAPLFSQPLERPPTTEAPSQPISPLGEVTSMPVQPATAVAPDSLTQRKQVFDEARKEGAAELEKLLNAGRGVLPNRNTGGQWLITESSKPDVIVQVTSVGPDGVPIRDMNVTTEEGFNDLLKDPELLEAATLKVRPDVAQARQANLKPLKARRDYEYHYRLRLREVGPGTAPSGWVRSSGRDVFYDRPLTSSEIRDFEMEPVGAILKSPEAAAPVVAQEPAVPAQQPTTEKLAKVRAKRDELFSKLRRKGGQVSMGIDPEWATIAAEIAGTYVEEGVVRFADFAARVKADASDLWSQLRRYLHGAWTSNGTVNTALDEVTRTQAADILDQLDAAEEAEPVADEIPPVENTDPVPERSPAGEPPTPDERNAKLGFGQRKRRSVNQLLADGDQNYLFETLFDEAQMAAAMRSSPADVQRVRDVVRRLPEYAEYQVEKAKTPDQRREENAPLAEQTQQDVAALNNIAGFTTSIAADGRVQVSEYPDVYKPMLTRNGFVFDPAAQAFVNPNYSKVLGFVQELRDDIAGLTTTKQNRTPDGQYRARARALQQSETNEAVIPAEVVQQTLGARVKALIMRGLGRLPEDVLVDQIHDVTLMTKAQQDGKPMFLLSSGTGTGKTFVLAGFIAEMRRLGVSGKIVFVTRSKALADQNRTEMAPFLEGTGNLQELINAVPVEQRQEVVDSWLRRNPEAADALQKAVDAAAEANIEELALEEAIDRFGGKGLFFQVVDGAIATFRRVSGKLRPVGGYPIKGRLGELRPDWNFLKPVVLGENGQILPLSERFGTPEEQDAAYLDQLTVPNDSSVDFLSYADIDNAKKFAPTESDIIIFDEAHEIRYNGEDVPSSRAKKAEAWIRKSKFTVFSTATPVESVQQMRFLWPTGVFNLLPGDRPYGNEEGDWFNFVAAAGGKILVSTDGKPKSTEFPAATQVEDTMFARDFLYKKGMMAQRSARIPAEMVDTAFSEVEGTKQWADLANAIMEAGKAMGKIDRSTKAYITHLLKRVLEQSKMEAGAQLALREAELGRQVVLYVETRSERLRDLPEIVQTWDEAKRNKTPLPADFSPKMEGAIELFRRLIAAGITEINFPSVQDVFRRTLGEDKVAFYTGEETGKTGDNNLGRWRNGEVPILVSTYQRGGTGLSLHDTSEGGVAPRSQIVLALPWRATETEQLLGRIVRYGMTSKANVFMLFANNIANENSLAAKVAGRLNSMSLFVRGAPSDTGTRINSWEFDPLQNVFEPVVELPALPMPTDGAAQEIVETAQLESSAQPAASAKPTDRVVGNVSMESMNAGLSKLARLFPRIRNIVRIDTLANLLADPNITDGEKDKLRQGAQGIYYRGRILVAQDNVRQTIFHKNQEVAAMAVIFHELMHLGADVIRSSPQLRSLYARWNSMLSSFVSETDMDALVRQGYDEYANWRKDPEKELRLREEMFVRKLENLLNRKGAEFFGPEGNMVRAFIDWLRDLLNRVFDLTPRESMSDSVLLEWGREFTRAANLAGYYRYIQDVNVRDVIMQSLVRSDAGYLRLVEGGDSGTDNLSALVKAAPAADRANVIEQWTQRNPQSAAELQRMVGEAAKTAGYTTEGWHGSRSREKFTTFDDYFAGSGADMGRTPDLGKGFYFTPSKEDALGYARNDEENLFHVWLRLDTPATEADLAKYGDDLVYEGFDGVMANDGMEYTVFNPSQIKSADSVTVDDQGNVIPLSERFQTISPDIRRSAAPLEGMELPAGNGTPRTGLETLTKEEEALFEAFQKQGKIESSLKLTQVLGFRSSGNVNARETLMPLKGEAMATIGFDEDAMGRPIVTEEASANARRIALQLLNPATGFGERYQNQFGPESAATAVLQLELVRYAMAMLQKGDYSLLGMLRTNMNSVVLGAYATATFAGRILAARRFYVSDVLRTIEEYNSLAEKAILKSYLKEGATEDEARDAVKAVRDAVERAELTEEQLRNLRDAFEKKPEAEKLESQAPDILERISRGLETVGGKAAQLYKNFTNLVLQREAVESARAKAKAASAADKNVSASFFVLPDESSLPTDLAALDALAASLDTQIDEVYRQLEAEMAPPKRKKRPTTGTKIPAPKEEPTEDEQQIEETEDVNEATAAAQRVLEELKAFLDRKFSNKAPKPTIYDFIRKLVNNRIANSEELTYPQFLERINAELGGMDIAPEVLEELVTKAWTVFKRHPIKNAEKISARFQKLLGDWVPYRRQLPAKTEQLQALVQRFVRNPDGLELGEFMDQMVPQLEALGISEELSNKLAEDTFNEFGRRIEEKATNRFNTIREALIERAKEQPLGTNSEGDPSDRLWRMDTLRTVLEESGLSDEEIANALPRFTQSDLDYFFGETPPENLTPRVRNSRIERVRRRYEESLKRPKEEKTSIARQDNIRRLLRRQLRIPASQNTFVAQAAMFGATVEQANELFLLTEQERALYVTEQGRSPTVLSKLIEYIRSAPAAIRNQPQNRDAAIRDFLESNGFDKTQIRAAMPWITREFNKFIAQAKEKALAAEAKRIEDNLKRSEARRTVSQTEKLLSLIKKDLELVRTGLGTVIENSGAGTEPDPMEVIAKRLGFEGFRPEDYQSLSDLDATITRALEDGRAHDMARGLKELYDLMGRRKAPKNFMQQLAVSYNNSALSGVGTLAINVVAPGGALAVRAALDMFKHLSRGNLKGVADVQQIMLDSMKNIVREVEFSLVGGANLNAMQAMIGRETNLQPELRDNLAKYRNKKLSPQARLFAGFRVLMAYTDLTRRLLGTTDHVWYTVMQNYFLKTQGLKELTNAGIPREKAMALLFNQTQETSSLLQSELTTITNLETALNEASDAELGNKVSEFLKAEIAANTPDELRVFEEDFKAAIRRTFVAYQSFPTKARKNLMAEIRLQKSASFLRANDRNKKAMKANIVGLMDPSKQAEVQNNLDVAEIKETEFEMGTHRGEESPNWDVANVLSKQIQEAGSTVLRSHPILGRMLLGYFGIPLNLLNRSLWFTPYGLIRYGIAKKYMATPEGRATFYQQSMNSQAQIRQRFVEAMVGTAASIALLALQALGDEDDNLLEVTLAGPTPKAEYDAWYKAGHRRNSLEFNVGGVRAVLNYGRGPLESLKIALILAGAVNDMRLNRKLGEDQTQFDLAGYLGAVLSGWNQQASFFGAKTTIGATLSVQPDANVLGTALYKLNPVIPFSGLISSVEKFITGPNQFRGRQGALFMNLPLARSLLTERAVNPLGDPVGLSLKDPFSQTLERLWYAGMPMTITTPLSGRDAQIYQFILDRGIAPGLPQRSALEAKNGLMWDNEWQRYVEVRGQFLKEDLARNLARFSRMSDDDLSKAIGELSTRATKQAKRYFRYQ